MPTVGHSFQKRFHVLHPWSFSQHAGVRIFYNPDGRLIIYDDIQGTPHKRVGALKVSRRLCGGSGDTIVRTRGRRVNGVEVSRGVGAAVVSCEDVALDRMSLRNVQAHNVPVALPEGLTDASRSRE